MKNFKSQKPNYYDNSKYRDFSSNNQTNKHYVEVKETTSNFTRKFVPDFELACDFNDILRVSTYNILADSNSALTIGLEESELNNYPFISWESRRDKLIKEIKALSSDIVGIQELEKDLVMIEELKKIGYEIVFKPRTGDHSEGCALLVKNSKFDIIDVYSLVFNMNQSTKDISPIYDRDNCAVLVTLKVKSNGRFIVAACTHLLFNKNRGDIKLAQIYQLSRAIDKLKTHLKETYPTNKDVVSILCADLNSLPNSGIYKLLTSGEINLKESSIDTISGQRSALCINDYEIKELKGQLFKRTHVYDDKKKQKSTTNIRVSSEEWLNDILRVEPEINFQDSEINLKYVENYKYTEELTLKNPITFQSAYSSLLGYIVSYFANQIKSFPFTLMNIPQDKSILGLECFGFRAGKDIASTKNFTLNLTLEPPFTCFNKYSLYTSDYIFFEGQDFNVLRCLNIPDITQFVSENRFLPSEAFPSDHICLTSDFIFQ